MIVRDLMQILDTEHDVEAPNGNWRSRRLLLKKDQAGFSMHDTVIKKGTETYIWYKNHLEAVYCVGGHGEIEDLDNNVIHNIKDGILYVLNGHEKHLLRANEDMRLICVFTPPLTGKEVHNKEGSYEIEDIDGGS